MLSGLHPAPLLKTGLPLPGQVPQLPVPLTGARFVLKQTEVLTTVLQHGNTLPATPGPEQDQHLPITGAAHPLPRTGPATQGHHRVVKAAPTRVHPLHAAVAAIIRGHQPRVRIIPITVLLQQEVAALIQGLHQVPAAATVLLQEAAAATALHPGAAAVIVPHPEVAAVTALLPEVAEVLTQGPLPVVQEAALPQAAPEVRDHPAAGVVAGNINISINGNPALSGSFSTI